MFIYFMESAISNWSANFSQRQTKIAKTFTDIFNFSFIFFEGWWATKIEELKKKLQKIKMEKVWFLVKKCPFLCVFFFKLMKEKQKSVQWEWD